VNLSEGHGLLVGKIMSLGINLKANRITLEEYIVQLEALTAELKALKVVS
jgi:hypothetical protein